MEYTTMYNGIMSSSDVSLVSFAIFFKLALLLGILVFSAYAFLLMKRVKILSETIFTPSNSFVKLLTVINIFVILIGGLIAVILI